MKAGQDTSHLPVQPHLNQAHEQFLIDFRRLCTTREGGMGIMPISWLKVEEYGHIVGYDDYLRHVLHCVVEALDPIYMEHVNEQIKSNKPSN